MQRKLTISIDAAVYDGLYRLAGARNIGHFIEELVKPHLEDEIERGFRALAAYERETGMDNEALEWSDGLIGDVADEPR